MTFWSALLVVIAISLVGSVGVVCQILQVSPIQIWRAIRQRHQAIPLYEIGSRLQDEEDQSRVRGEWQRQRLLTAMERRR